MEAIRNQFYRILEIFTSFLFLNIIWVICCLPIFTIFPATTALFAVVRKWNVEGIDYGVFKPFIFHFKANFKKAFVAGVIWFTVGAVFLFDIYILTQMVFPGKVIITALLMFCSMTFLLTSIYLFPVLVHFELTIGAVFKNALFLAVGKLGTTVLICFVLACFAAAVYFLPILLLVASSVASFIVYQLCSRTFIKQ